MKGPADSPDIIESNLIVFAALTANKKLKSPDPLTGLYSIGGTFFGRSSEDSIVLQAANIRSVFEAAYRHAIDYAFTSRDNHSRDKWFRLIYKAKDGMSTLRQTYSNQIKSKSNQKASIDDITPHLDIHILAMKAFIKTRDKYSSGFKSMNKAYASSDANFAVFNKQRPTQIKALQPAYKLKQPITGTPSPSYEDRHRKAVKLFQKIRYGNDPAIRIRNDRTLVQANCHELAEYAYRCIRDSGYRNVMVCCLEGKYMNRSGDHVFAVIGENAFPPGTSLNKDLLYQNNYWVVDPWANICCPCILYPNEFALKTDKWANNNKMVAVSNSAAARGAGPLDGSEWINPSEDWYRNSIKEINWVVL